MADVRSLRPQMAAALSAIATLLLLLILGGTCVYRASKPSAEAPPPIPVGPVAKMANWVEPPPRVGGEMEFESLIDLITTEIAPSQWQETGSIKLFEANFNMVLNTPKAAAATPDTTTEKP